MGQLLVFSFIFTTASACFAKKPAGDEATPKIAYGSEVKADEPIARATVALVAPSINSAQAWFPYCSGTLIAPKVVITAAHCVEGSEAIQLAFGLGTLDKPQLARGRYTRHPNYGAEYNEALSFDLALIKLDEPAPAGMQPVPLAAAKEFRIGDTVWLAGYGDLIDAKGKTQPNPGKLYKVSSRIVDVFGPGDQDIRDDYENWGLITYNSPDGKSGACSGDSGGPMFIERAGALKLIGATAGGFGNCGAQGMHTNLSFYESWIKETLAQLEKSR